MTEFKEGRKEWAVSGGRGLLFGNVITVHVEFRI
jgi:hypothetical protein